MPGGRIDREAWARELKALIARFDPRQSSPDGLNKSAFAQRIGMARRTVERWIAQETDVDPESVHIVADKLKLTQAERVQLLQAIGYFMPAAPVVPDPADDPIIRAILADPRWTDEQRAELVQDQVDRIEADLDRRRTEYERLVKLRGQAS